MCFYYTYAIADPHATLCLPTRQKYHLSDGCLSPTNENTSFDENQIEHTMSGAKIAVSPFPNDVMYGSRVGCQHPDVRREYPSKKKLQAEYYAPFVSAMKMNTVHRSTSLAEESTPLLCLPFYLSYRRDQQKSKPFLSLHP